MADEQPQDAERTTSAAHHDAGAPSPSGWPPWALVLGGFVAGLLVAGGVALGLEAAEDDEEAVPAPTVITTTTTIPAPDVDELAGRLDLLCAQLSGFGQIGEGVRLPDDAGEALETLSRDLARIQDDLQDAAAGELGTRTDQLQELVDALDQVWARLDTAVDQALEGNLGLAEDTLMDAREELEDAWALAADLDLDQCTPMAS